MQASKPSTWPPNVVECLFPNKDLDYDDDVVHWPSFDHWPRLVRCLRLQAADLHTTEEALRLVRFVYAQIQAGTLQEADIR